MQLSHVQIFLQAFLVDPPSVFHSASAASPIELMSALTALSPRDNSAAKATEDGDEGDLAELNNSLVVLATLFPRVEPLVFREMLQIFDGESRLYVVTEQLLKHQCEWVKGRWRKVVNEVDESEAAQKRPVAVEDLFRRSSYKSAVRTLLYGEFKALGTSNIDRVLVEQNFCYTRTRLSLQNLSSRSWRNKFDVVMSKWLKLTKLTNSDHHIMIRIKSQDNGAISVPVLKEAGDRELEEELHQNVLLPFLRKAARDREDRDWEIAKILNETEAIHAEAMYECQCCFSDTTFEQMATCTTGAHVLCFQCIKNAVSEALFGQSWARNIEFTRGLLKCLAPMSTENCDGCISHNATHQAIVQSKGGEEVFSRLVTRLAEENLKTAGLALVNCPFCAYAEVDELYFPSCTLRYRLNTANIKVALFLILLMSNCIPLLMLYALVSRLPLFRKLPTITKMLTTSLARLSRSRHLSQRFQCRSPLCSLPSCLTCFKIWHDPHVCHESAALSLRTAIEAARTAALKRTCPSCGLGFIKDSGCNKLTCICGYAMCYTCRQGLGRGYSGETYRHFCQHFRPAGGVCRECDKCDLYLNEDDEALVKRAGALAEIEWREKEGMTGVVGIGGGLEKAPRATRLDAGWTWQDLLDWWVRNVIDC